MNSTAAKGSLCVCVIALNEEKHIEATLGAILAGAERESFPVRVYPNGCTDRTVEIAQGFSSSHPNVEVRVLPVASKPNAWNTAFSENDHEFLVFSDGDVLPEPGAATRLARELTANPACVIASCRRVPATRGLGVQQKLVGFLDMPLVQDFLAGGFYAVRRAALAELLAQEDLTALPAGVAGEDCFLDRLVGHERVLVSDHRTAYVPPDFRDYCQYLARIRWQNEQAQIFLGGGNPRDTEIASRLTRKLRRSRSLPRLAAGAAAVLTRCAFRLLARAAIEANYRRLGQVRPDGAAVLSTFTRSKSTK